MLFFCDFTLLIIIIIIISIIENWKVAKVIGCGRKGIQSQKTLQKTSESCLTPEINKAEAGG